MLVTCNAALAVDSVEASGLAAEMWRVEVVMDKAIGITESLVDRSDVCVYEIVVAESYRQPNGTKFKAHTLN